MKNMRLTKQVLLAILGAWAVVFRFFSFPLLPAATFLKFDFSDIPVFIGLLVNGPIGAAVVALIRDVIEYLRKGGEAGIPLGVTMSFVGSMAMMLPIHIASKRWKAQWSFRQMLLIALAVMTSLTVVMTLLNYFVALPIYMTVMNWPIPDVTQYLVASIVPFNLLKGAVVTGLVYLILRQFSTYLRQRGLLQVDY